MAVINKDQFLQNFHFFDSEVVVEIIDIFIDEYPNRMQTLKNNVDNLDFDQLRFNAHSIKGVIANFVAPEAQELARSLELKGANKEDNDLNQLYADLEEKTGEMLEELKVLKKNFE